MIHQFDRVAADEVERHQQDRESSAFDARAVTVRELAERKLREMSDSDLADLIANTPAAEVAATNLIAAVASLSEASWMLFARNLRRALVDEQERREAAYLKQFRSDAWVVL